MSRNNLFLSLERFKASLPCGDQLGLQKHRCGFAFQQQGSHSPPPPPYFPSGKQKPFKWNSLVFTSTDAINSEGRRAVYWKEQTIQAVRSREERSRQRQRAQSVVHGGTKPYRCCERFRTRREDERRNALSETRPEPDRPTDTSHCARQRGLLSHGVTGSG